MSLHEIAIISQGMLLILGLKCLSDFLISYFKVNENAIREALEQLPEEPLENVNTVRIRLRGLQGNTVQRTFYTTDTTEVMFLILSLHSSCL